MATGKEKSKDKAPDPAAAEKEDAGQPKPGQPKQLSREELEELRNQLQKKFH